MAMTRDLYAESRRKVALIEEVREVCGLPRYVMYRLLNVSRQTYTAWLRGATLRSKNSVQVSLVGKALLLAYKDSRFPLVNADTPWDKITQAKRLVNHYVQFVGD